MRTDHPRHLDLSAGRNTTSDAIILGVCSLAAQAVFLRMILSSQPGGELYAALALGGWIGWVAVGSFIGKSLSPALRERIWLLSAIIKLPLACIITIYPGLFQQMMDPVRFLPMALIGMAGPGMLYGILFSLLAKLRGRTSAIYKFEAAGSFIGGIAVTVWVFLGLSGFGLLIILAFVEISIYWRRAAVTVAAIAAGAIAALILSSQFDRAMTSFRWRNFQVSRIAHGHTGDWIVLSDQGQSSLVRAGTIIASYPDRPASEEALLWPLLYKPESKSMLLIGYEGIQTAPFLPPGLDITNLYSDPAYIEILADSAGRSIYDDPLNFRPQRKYDIVAVQLHGAATLYDYRLETSLFFERCRQLMDDDGILYINAPFDENYSSDNLNRYIARLEATLKSIFPDIAVIPGPNAGFVCGVGAGVDIPSDVLAARLDTLGIVSPYFNGPLIANRLLPFKKEQVERSLNSVESNTNDVFRPISVLQYLQWQGSRFGKTAGIFKVYQMPYILLFIPLMILIPVLFGRWTQLKPGPLLVLANFGFMGMAFEIVNLYLFQIILGSLYLHIGMILAVFMAGMALGSMYVARHRILSLFAISILAFCILLIPLMLDSQIDLRWTGFLMYISSLFSGFLTGGGFAAIANRYQDGAGPWLYGIDLLGGLIAALFVPGLVISVGTFFVFYTLIFMYTMNYATLTFEKY